MTATLTPTSEAGSTSAQTRHLARAAAAGIERVTRSVDAVPYNLPSSTTYNDPAVAAVLNARLERLYRIRARWWSVLHRATLADYELASLYVRALVQARSADDEMASEYGRLCSRWTDRALTDRARAAEISGEPYTPSRRVTGWTLG